MEGLIPSRLCFVMSFSPGKCAITSELSIHLELHFYVCFMEGSEDIMGKAAEASVNKVLICFLSIRNDSEEKFLVQLCREFWQIIYSLPTIHTVVSLLTLVSDSIYGWYSNWVFSILPACFQSNPKSDFNRDCSPLYELHWSGIILFLIICASENLSNFSWYFDCLEI